MSKRVLISGATGALGRATALEAAKQGVSVVLLARNKAKLDDLKAEILKATGNREVEIIIGDFSDISLTNKAVSELRQKFDQLNALINIAAVYRNKRVVTKDNLEIMFQTNHLAPFILTNGILDLLKAGNPSKIITVTAPSFTKINFDDLQGVKKFSSLNSFGSSKMMNLMFTYFLANRLEGTGITASAFHPGLMRSGLTSEMPSFIRFLTGLLSGSPDRAAKMLCSLTFDNPDKDTNGRFYKYNGKELRSSPYSYNRKFQEDLWKISEKLSVLS